MPPKSGFAPKLRVLTKDGEDPGSFEAWRETLIFTLTLDGGFEEFLEDGFRWGPLSTANRGLEADGPDVKENRLSAKQKSCMLKLMLGTIASYATVISRPFITEEARCLDDIWNRLRIYYGFRKIKVEHQFLICQLFPWRRASPMRTCGSVCMLSQWIIYLNRQME